MQDTYPLQVLVSFGLAVLGLTLLARAMRVAPPIALLVGGVALGFVPWLKDVQLPPSVVRLFDAACDRVAVGSAVTLRAPLGGPVVELLGRITRVRPPARPAVVRQCRDLARRAAAGTAAPAAVLDDRTKAVHTTPTNANHHEAHREPVAVDPAR